MAASSNELVYRDEDGTVKVLGLTDDELDLFIDSHEAYKCPITQELMVDPVVAFDSYTYDHATIKNWVNSKGTSPLTRASIANQFLPNRALKEARDTALKDFMEKLRLETAAKKVEGQTQNPTLNPSDAVESTPTAGKPSNEASIPAQTAAQNTVTTSVPEPRTLQMDSPPIYPRSILMAAPVMPSSAHSSSSSSSSIPASVMPSSAHSSSSSSSSIAASVMHSNAHSSSSSSSSIAASVSPAQQDAIKAYTRRLGIMRYLTTSNIDPHEKNRQKIQYECDSTIARIETDYPNIKEQISLQAVEQARQDFVRKFTAVPREILSLYNTIREEHFNLADSINNGSLSTVAEIDKALDKQKELLILEQQLEEDWPEIRYRLRIDQARGIPIQAAANLSNIPRRSIIPAPFLPDRNVNTAPKSSAIVEGFRAFTSRFFPTAAPQTPSSASRSDSHYDYLLKIALVGDGHEGGRNGAGKSCLILRFADDIYTNAFINDINVDFKLRTIPVNGSVVKLQIWDTKSSGEYGVDLRQYARADAIIVAFDVTNRTSFDNITKWLKAIDNFAGHNVIITLAATKCDAPKAEWQVDEKEIWALAEGLRKNVFFTSAKMEGNKSVDQLFEGVANSVIPSRKQSASRLSF